LQRACRDCHSDNTVWPWYAGLPPVSWQIHGDVERGRAFMNLSKWSEYSDEQRRGYKLAILAVTQAGVMPPPKYVWMHGSAKLSDAEIEVLRAWALGETNDGCGAGRRDLRWRRDAGRRRTALRRGNPERNPPA
jgi:Haem-binding domain